MKHLRSQVEGLASDMEKVRDTHRTFFLQKKITRTHTHINTNRHTSRHKQSLSLGRLTNALTMFSSKTRSPRRAKGHDPEQNTRREERDHSVGSEERDEGAKGGERGKRGERASG